MLLMPMAAAPPLVNVAALGAPPFPIATVTQLMLVGLTVALPVAAAPVLFRSMVCGLLVAVSVKLSVAVREPAAVGLNTIAAVQLADAARLVPHVLLDTVKSAAFVPLIVTALR